jgi:hypothetical protein
MTTKKAFGLFTVASWFTRDKWVGLTYRHTINRLTLPAWCTAD